MMKFDKEFVADLACFMQGYVKEIQGHLIDIVDQIYADPTLRLMLHEYRVRCQKRDDDFLRDLDWCLNHGSDWDGEEFILNHSKSFHDVLDALLVKDWWHDYCQKDKEDAA